jgi:hypothetical protein
MTCLGDLYVHTSGTRGESSRSCEAAKRDSVVPGVLALRIALRGLRQSQARFRRSARSETARGATTEPLRAHLSADFTPVASSSATPRSTSLRTPIKSAKSARTRSASPAPWACRCRKSPCSPRSRHRPHPYARDAGRRDPRQDGRTGGRSSAGSWTAPRSGCRRRRRSCQGQEHRFAGRSRRGHPDRSEHRGRKHGTRILLSWPTRRSRTSSSARRSPYSKRGAPTALLHGDSRRLPQFSTRNRSREIHRSFPRSGGVAIVRN